MANIHFTLSLLKPTAIPQPTRTPGIHPTHLVPLRSTLVANDESRVTALWTELGQVSTAMGEEGNEIPVTEET